MSYYRYELRPMSSPLDSMSYKLSAIGFTFPRSLALRFFAMRSALCVFLRNFAIFILQFAICNVFIFFVFFSIAHADFWDVVSKIHPSLGFQEKYSDNINLTSTNPQADWITTIYPGLRFSTSRAEVTTPGLIQQTPEEPSGIDLQYRLGLGFFAKNVENNYISQDGTLNAWYTSARNLSLRLREYFIRSDEPLEGDYIVGALPNQYLLGIQRQRSIYTRNVFEPSLGYQFGRENRFDLYYRNNIYDNESPSIEDSKENYINPRFSYWFDIHNGVTLEYGFTRGDFERSPDLVGHMARTRYTYRFNPHTSIFGEYIYLKRDFESPGIDYNVHNPSIGIEHAFSPTLSGRLQAGYFWQYPEIGSSKNGLSCDANLTQRTEKTTYILSFQGGYREDYFTAENLGFTQYYRAFGTITHRPIARMTIGLYAAGERDEYSSDRKDWVWMAGGSASYEIFRWMILSLEAYHREDDSTVDTASYIETRGIFRLSLSI